MRLAPCASDVGAGHTGAMHGAPMQNARWNLRFSGRFTRNSWCRRRDSNSHSFRHYPLKIACLPISPRRLLRKSSAFLESRTFYHAIAASRQFVPARPSPRRCRTGPSRSGNKPLQARRPLASICHVARQYWHPHAHTRGCSRGISSGYSYEREFVGAHAWPAYDASHTQQGLRPVERFHHATSDLPHSGSSPHAARRPAQFAPLRRRFVAAGLPRSAPAARIR